jgi:hypothetical protein
MSTSALSQLHRELHSLAAYNDKGIEWTKATPEQVEVQRASSMRRIRELVAQIGALNLPDELLRGIDSGAVSVDPMGHYAVLVRDEGNLEL